MFFSAICLHVDLAAAQEYLLSYIIDLLQDVLS